MSALAKHYTDGTHRVCRPEETLERVATLMPTYGITRLANVTHLDILDIPVFQAIRPGSRNICVSQGKGISIPAAMASAVMESLELAHAEDLGDLEQEVTTLASMERRNSIRSDWLLWRDLSRDRTARKLSWLPAVSLAGTSNGWLPREMIELDFSISSASQPTWFHRTSNGLASGNVIEEALVHGLCEIIERHALAHAQTSPDRRRAIDTTTLPDPACQDLLTRIRHKGAKVLLFDLTSEIGVPTIAAEIVLADLGRIWTGSGCHLCPTVAATRAITEAAQSRLTFLSATRDDLDDPSAEPLSNHGIYDEFQEPSSGTNFSSLPDLSTPDLSLDVEVLVDRLVASGRPPYFVDLTRHGTKISVVRTFAPFLGEALHA